MRKIELSENCIATLINTAQFKDVLLTVRFLAPIDRKRVLIRNILAEMLQDRCEKWPTKQALSNHLDDLYGASVSSRCQSFGNLHALELRFKALNDQYTQENTFERLFKTAHEFVFNPLKKEELLDEELFKEVKRETMMANQRKLEQPQSLAVAKVCAIFGEGCALGETQLYKKEEIEAITLEEVNEEYHKMVEEEPVFIFVVGKIDEEKTQAYCRRFFPFGARQDFEMCSAKIERDGLIEKNESRPIDQTILTMIFSTEITVNHPDYWKLRVANGLFGQLPTSLLFTEVREKRSLCYSVSSSTLGYEGAILVATGIQKKDVEEAKECILKQVKRLAEGDFEDELLETSIKMTKNAVRASLDDPFSSLNFAFQNILFSKNETRDECIEQIESVTKQDILRIFKKVDHKVTFVLEQEGDDEASC